MAYQKVPYHMILCLALGVTVVIPVCASAVLADYVKPAAEPLPLRVACPDRTDFACLLAEAQKESIYGR